MNSPKALYKYLKGNKDGVADLVTKANFMGKLNQEFLKLVTTPVNLHLQLAYINGSKLHVIADSPAWASKFRFMSSHIIPTLKKNIQYFQYVKEITVTTRPSSLKRDEERVSRPRHISNTAKECLEDMAQSLDNKELQKSLLRLAKKHKNK